MTEPQIPQAADLSPDALGSALADIAAFLAPAGWDLPPQMFALVPTALLARDQPDVIDPADTSELSPIAQEPLAGTASIESTLATTSWPPVVVGTALAQEIVVLPPGADDGPAEASADHPDGTPARLIAGALRDGRTLALLQLRPDTGDEPGELRTHADLASDLRVALAHTLDRED